MRYLIVFLLIAATALAVSPAHAARNQQIIEFHQVEQQNWQEYIARFADFQQDSTFDVTFYHIDIDIALDSQFIMGKVLCGFESAIDNLSQIKLNLQDSLIIDSITGDAASFSHTGDTITILLDSSLPSGLPADVSIWYRGHPPVIEATKGLRYTSHGSGERIIASLSTPFLAHYWWPCKDGPGDKPDSVYIDITIPDTVINGLPLIATSNGALDTVVTTGGKKTFKWREQYPIVPYYVMVAISNYQHLVENYSGVGGNFPLEYFAFNENLSATMVGIDRVPEVMDFFSTVYGPYPFADEKYAVTEIGFYGGIENQTNSIQGALDQDWFEVTVHELSHMWFGDNLTCQSWHHGWLNEGFATYSEALWAEYDGGLSAYRATMKDFEYYSGNSLYLDDISDPFNIFIGIIYYKGAWVLHMLRGVLGDDDFFDCIYAYATTPEFQYNHVVTEDFRNVCETVSGQDLDWFFQQWVYGDKYPIYRWSYFSVRNPGTSEPFYTTYIPLNQVQTTDPQLFLTPLQFQVFMGAGYQVFTIDNNQRSQIVRLDTNFEPDSIKMDPFNWVLESSVKIPFPLTIVTETLNTGVQCIEYADTILALSTSGIKSYKVIDGLLPEGYALDTLTGIINGVTFTDIAEFACTIQATDSSGHTATREFFIPIETLGPNAGDANCDGLVNVGDAIYLINHIFRQGPAPSYPNWADANADCSINVGDAVYLINYIFNGGPSPILSFCME